MPFAPEYLHLVFPNTQFEAILYGRASRDPKKEGHSVEDQLSTGRTLCHDSGWPIVEEFKDLGLSASRHATRARDDFEELLAAIEDEPARPGVTRIVVAFEASRYYRDLEAYVRLRNACHHAGVLLCYKGTVYDLSRTEDRRATAMDAIAAEGEADDIRDRNLRTTRRTAAAGNPHGRLLYGYARDYDVVSGQLRCVRQYEHPENGRFVYESFTRFDSGTSLRSLVQWLRSQPEAARPDGVQWTEVHVRRMLLNRAYLGERVHRGEWRPGTWDPIKGLETPAGRALFNRVTATLNDPGRRVLRGTAVSHLLSLIALCGHCGDHALLEQVPLRGTPYLRCRAKKDVTIREDWMDAYVEEALIEWFRDKKTATAALLPSDGDVEEKVAAAQRRINGFEEQLREAQQLSQEFDEETGRFKLSAGALSSMEQRLMPKLEQERKKLQNMTGVSPLLLSLLSAADPDTVWNGRSDGEEVQPLSLEQKREVIRKVVTVRLHKAVKRGVHRLEPGRITLAFFGTPGFRDRPSRVPASVPAEVPGPAASPGRG